jgi:GNAT superfamily N-acetyltransferase
MPRPAPEFKKIDLNDEGTISQILTLQKLGYSKEAEIIGYTNIPPLFDTTRTILQSSERFTGLYLGNQLVGMISTSQSNRVLEICRLVVHPRHMGRKYATKLLAYIEAAQPCLERIIVSTAEHNLPALALYNKCGYKQIDSTVTCDGLTLVKLEKTLLRTIRNLGR